MLRSIVVLLSVIAVMGGQARAFDVEFAVIDGTASYTDIQIKGTMTAWATVPMDDTDGDHTWQVTLDVSPGAHEWGAIENDGSEYGIWLIMGPNLAFVVDAEGNVSGQTTYEIPVPAPTVDVTFLVGMNGEDVSAQGVHVVGSFQGWYPDTTPMADPDNDGVYAVTLALAENSTFQYKFINGNTFDDAEQVPATCGVDDAFGGYNRQIVVHDAADGDQVEGFVFGTCDVPTPSESSTFSQLKASFR